MIDISGHLRNYRQECGFDDSTNFITVNCCGFQKFITKNFTRHREKGRLDYQIIYIVRGKGFFKLGGSMTPVSEGNIVVYSPNEEQHYTYCFEDFPEVYWLHFTGYGSQEWLDKSGLSSGQTFYIGLSNTCIEAFKRIINELQVKKTMHEEISNALFLELLSIMGRRRIELSGNSNHIKDKNIQRVIEKIHSSYNLKWSVKDFARECNLSVFRFIHVFKEYTHLSPLEYLTKVRIDKARELLMDSSLNISEISDIIGYDNPLYFSRIFKKTAGSSPSKFRKGLQI